MFTVDTLLAHHLQHNHYPPVPLTMLETCKTAIDLAIEDDWYALVPLPDGITYRGQDHAPVHEIVKQHHLDHFIEQDFIAH
jgi:hypothetical protein